MGLPAPASLVAVPDLPGLGEGEVTRRTFDAARRVTRAVSEFPDVRGGRIALAGASTGAGISLVTAADPEVASSVSVVCSIVPYADIKEIVRLATTNSYTTDNGSTNSVTSLLRRTVGRSLVCALPDGVDRNRLLVPLRAVADDDLDPIRHLSGVDVATPEARAVVALLLNRDATRFATLYDALPSTVIGDLRGAFPDRDRSRCARAGRDDRPAQRPVFPNRGSGCSEWKASAWSTHGDRRARPHTTVDLYAIAIRCRRVSPLDRAVPGCSRIVSNGTHLTTRIWLIASLAITVVTLLGLERDGGGADQAGREVGIALSVLTVLFVTRVAGQILVALVRAWWLPPMVEWNLTPYRLLLPAQLAILVVMTWIDITLLRGRELPYEPAESFGQFLLVLSGLYAVAMAARYVIRMSRRPDARWFGGAIPIVFHQVLAAYLFILGDVCGTLRSSSSARAQPDSQRRGRFNTSGSHRSCSKAPARSVSRGR